VKKPRFSVVAIRSTVLTDLDREMRANALAAPLTTPLAHDLNGKTVGNPDLWRDADANSFRQSESVLPSK
jgi:hypothetical protein